MEVERERSYNISLDNIIKVCVCVSLRWSALVYGAIKLQENLQFGHFIYYAARVVYALFVFLYFKCDILLTK